MLIGNNAITGSLPTELCQLSNLTTAGFGEYFRFIDDVLIDF